jgi:tetratricopeptide (TPR) repeat protein
MDQEQQTADTMLQTADSTFQQRDYETALSQYNQALEMSREEFNRPVEVEALSQIARMLLLLNQKEEGKKHLSEAALRADQEDIMGWSRYLGVKGRFEWRSGDFKTARETFEQLYDYCSLNDLWPRAVDAAHMIAIVSDSPQDQIEWGKKGIEIAEARETDNWLGPLWNNLAGTYFDMKQFEQALDCYLKARNYHWRFYDERAKLIADYHVGMTHRLMRNFDEAGKWLRPVLAWAERLNDHDIIAQTVEDLAEIDIANGKVSEGLAGLIRARDEYKLAGYEERSPEIWENINKRIDLLKND